MRRQGCIISRKTRSTQQKQHNLQQSLDYNGFNNTMAKKEQQINPKDSVILLTFELN